MPDEVYLTPDNGTINGVPFTKDDQLFIVHKGEKHNPIEFLWEDGRPEIGTILQEPKEGTRFIFAQPDSTECL